MRSPNSERLNHVMYQSVCLTKTPQNFFAHEAMQRACSAHSMNCKKKQQTKKEGWRRVELSLFVPSLMLQLFLQGVSCCCCLWAVTGTFTDFLMPREMLIAACAKFPSYATTCKRKRERISAIGNRINENEPRR